LDFNIRQTDWLISDGGALEGIRGRGFNGGGRNPRYRYGRPWRAPGGVSRRRLSSFRILLADDHPLVSRGVEELWKRQLQDDDHRSGGWSGRETIRAVPTPFRARPVFVDSWISRWAGSERASRPTRQMHRSGEGKRRVIASRCTATKRVCRGECFLPEARLPFCETQRARRAGAAQIQTVLAGQIYSQPGYCGDQSYRDYLQAFFRSVGRRQPSQLPRGSRESSSSSPKETSTQKKKDIAATHARTASPPSIPTLVPSIIMERKLNLYRIAETHQNIAIRRG